MSDAKPRERRPLLFADLKQFYLGFINVKITALSQLAKVLYADRILFHVGKDREKRAVPAGEIYAFSLEIPVAWFKL
jgi:hypothetical protein